MERFAKFHSANMNFAINSSNFPATKFSLNMVYVVEVKDVKNK